MKEPTARDNPSRWATVAVAIAPLFIAILLAALVIIPVVTHAWDEAHHEDVTRLAEPARYLLDTVAMTSGVQARAIRAALAFPEQRAQAELLYEETTRTQQRALTEMLSLTASLDAEVHERAELLAEHLSAWNARQMRFLSGELSLEEFRRAVPEQDELFAQATDEWRELSHQLQRFSDQRRQESFAFDRMETLITSGLAGAALLTLLLVVWLARRGQRLESAVRQRLLAERASSARAEVLAQVSHDLRSPLTAIITSAAAIKRTPCCDDPMLSRGLDRIDSAAHRMTRLVNDLLDHARLSVGQGLGMDAYDIDVVPIILRCREEVSPQRPERVSCHVDEQARRVIADPDRLEQVLVNLLSNALKFSPPSAPISVDVSADGHDAVFRVHDRGPGIPPDERAHLFEPFWQSPKARRPGYGLGLAIAAAIVEAHGGHIWLDESSPEHGSTFAFRLPRT